MCFGCSKEPSHRDGTFEYPHHMFWLRNKKNNFQLRTLIWGPESLIWDYFICICFSFPSNVVLALKGLMFCYCLVCGLTSQSTAMVMSRRSVIPTTLFFLGKLCLSLLVVIQYSVYIHLLVTDNLIRVLESAERRE